MDDLPKSKPNPGVARVVERNIDALLRERAREEQRLGRSERIAQKITGFTGSMAFVFLHAALFGVWIVVNLPWFPPIIPKFDPTYVVLAMWASVEAIFLSTFILITQNRMMKQADRRADLNLQISLLAEHEITRLIQLTSQICERMGIEHGRENELAELSHDVRPEKVLETMDQREERTPPG
jgi:uncharacterized membrane protein